MDEVILEVETKCENRGVDLGPKWGAKIPLKRGVFGGYPVHDFGGHMP